MVCVCGAVMVCVCGVGVIQLGWIEFKREMQLTISFIVA